LKVDIVYWEDEIGKSLNRVSVDVHPFGIQVGMRAEWQMAVAAEDKEVKAQMMVPIDIKPVDIPAKAIVLPCFFMRHALGIVTSLASLGRPLRVEDERRISQVLFYPIQDGLIRKDELLAVINIFPAAMEEPLPNKEAVYRWMSQRYGD